MSPGSAPSPASPTPPPVGVGGASSSRLVRTLSPFALYILQRLGSGAVAGLTGGGFACVLLALQHGGGPGLLLALQLLALGGGLGLGLGLISLATPRAASPSAVLARWLRAGPAGAGDRIVALLLAAIGAAHGLWSAGVWVDSTFHHKLLSSALLFAVLVLLLPPALAILRVGERLSGRLPEVALGLLVLVGATLGLRLAHGPTSSGLAGPLLLTSAALAAATAWTLVRTRHELCLLGLLLAPLALSLPFLARLLGVEAADTLPLLDQLQLWLTVGGHFNPPPSGLP